MRRVGHVGLQEVMKYFVSQDVEHGDGIFFAGFSQGWFRVLPGEPRIGGVPPGGSQPG